MKIAVASGKGGTGKTTVAINLARAAETTVQLLDCDVEEPNARLFLKPEAMRETEVTLPVPVVDAAKCGGCGECAAFCRFNAIVMTGDVPTVFADLCHGCGGCMRVCPRKAIREVPRRLGEVATARIGKIALVEGRLDVGAALTSPVVEAAKALARDDVPVIIDAPPGTACATVTTLRGVDYVVLVAEPTRFGLHDLKLAVRLTRALNVAFGVVVNRATGETCIADYCRTESIPLIGEIPDDRRIAESYARGEILLDALPDYRGLFRALFDAATKGSP